MGEKKRKEAETAGWKKVIVVGACVLFVVLMVVSGMGSGWLSMFAITQPGETVVIDYTLYNSAGIPIVTTDQQVFTKATTEGNSILAAKQIAIVANKSLTDPIFPVQVYTTSDGWNSEFALFAGEYDAISSAVVGMSANQKKSVTLPTSSSMTQIWSAEQLERNGITLDAVNVGDLFALGVSSNPNETEMNTSSVSYIRMAEITRKTPTGIVVDFSYPKIDISVTSVGGSS
ncbi:MAG: hypothetical protein M0Q92_15950 [Methanoregula sp.]|jgi:hypothetical protein|nr:hypothetical protein [Methanoregula sp.]